MLFKNSCPNFDKKFKSAWYKLLWLQLQQPHHQLLAAVMQPEKMASTCCLALQPSSWAVQLWLQPMDLAEASRPIGMPIFWLALIQGRLLGHAAEATAGGPRRRGAQQLIYSILPVHVSMLGSRRATVRDEGPAPSSYP